MKMTILLADDHALFRDGMHYVLRQLADDVEILDASSFSEMLKLADANPTANLVLMDLHMPGSNGAASVRTFNLKYPQMPLVVVSGSEQREDMERVMEFGAMGFISKMTSSKVMLAALRMVLDGGVYLPPQLLQQSMDHLEQGAADKRSRRSNEFGLTARQIDVLQYLSQGLSNKETALKMGLAEGTVKIHVAAIFQALHVSNRMDAVRAAQRLGMLPRIETA
ncbi:MAG TPA: response regulator transcription factor [Gallionellaceae bacterium]|nr:response regulator transcription factor [Gallionellaceae bacterium]